MFRSALPIRTCDQCGSKMPFGRNRVRQPDGSLICAGCAAGAPGTRMHGSANPSCPNCGEPVTWADTTNWPAAHQDDSWWNCPSCGASGDEDALSPSDFSLEVWSMRREAHDSGDGETIFHCPFCGGGQVWARSDGTTMCDFCDAAFTVQVQPVRSAMPQTVNGQPVQVPGMPGQAGSNADALADAADPAQPFQPPDSEAPAFSPPDQPVVAHYVTAAGAVLDEDGFERHLAILHADDRPAVIAQVKADRASHG